MKLIKGLNQSLMKFINTELGRFIFFGGVNTLIGYLVYSVLLLFVSYSVSYTIAYVIGIFVSYYFNSKFVFNQTLTLKKLLKYPSVYFIQYLSGLILIKVLVDFFSINKFIVPLIVIVANIPLTFITSRFIIKK